MIKKPNTVLVLLMLIIVGLNLRPVMATIGPLTDDLLANWELGYGWISLLNGLPIIMMGLGALLGQSLMARFNVRHLVILSLILIGCATLWRLNNHIPSIMIASSLLAGLGIAVVQAFMPIIIKHWWPEKTASYMGVYVPAIMAGAALSAALAPQLMHSFNINWALGSWGLLTIPAILLLIICVPTMPSLSNANTPTHYAKPPFNMRFWQLAAFFGFSTSGFTCMLAWLPPHFLDLGYPPIEAGLALSLLSATEVIAGVLFAQLAARSPDRRTWLMCAITLAIIGLLCLAISPSLAWLGVVLAGCGVGALFPLSMIICMDHLPDSHASGILTARVQGIGYLVAGTIPMLAGLLRDQMQNFNVTWLLLAVIFVLLLPLAASFNPRHYAARMQAT